MIRIPNDIEFPHPLKVIGIAWSSKLMVQIWVGGGEDID